MLAEKPKKGKAKPVQSSDDFCTSRFRSREDRHKNQYPAKIIPQWVEWVCASSNEVRVLAQIAYTFREGGSRLYEKDGYEWAYQRIKKLVGELPPMTEMQVRHALRGLIGRGIIVVEDEWMENNRMMRISARRVAELVAEWEAEGRSD